MEIGASDMELLETEGTEMPDDTIAGDVPATPEPTLPEDSMETVPSDGDIPEENAGENSGTDSGEDAGLPSVDDTMEEAEEDCDAPEELPVSVSGNDTVTVSGNAVIFPEDFDFSMFSVGDPDSLTGLDALIEAETYQTEVICSVSVGIMFFLGIIAWILLIHGFRLRRV